MATAVTATLTLYHLGSASLWADEGSTAIAVTGGFGNYLRTLAYEPNFALYHLMLWLFARLGDSEFVLRLPSVLFAVATVPTVFALARRVFGRATADIASVLVAVNVLIVGYGRECRPYALLAWTSTLSTLLLLRALEHSTSRRWTLWAISSAAMVLAHPFGLTVVAAHLAALLVRWRTVPWGELLHGAQETLILLAIATLVLVRIGPARLVWIPSLSVSGLVSTLENVVARRGPIPLLAELAAAAWAVVTTFRTRNPDTGVRWATTLMLAWLVVPVAVTVAVSLQQPVLVSRYLIVIVPPLAILAAAGAARLRPPVALAAGLILVLLAAPTKIAVPVSPPDDWRWAATTVLERARPGDLVVVSPFGQQAFRYYVRVRPAPAPFVPVVPGFRFQAALRHGDLGCNGRVWVALRAVKADPAVQAVLRDAQPLETFRRGYIRLALYGDSSPADDEECDE